MQLAEYLRILRRGWAILVAFVVLGAALGVGLTLATTPVYEASVRLFVATSGNTTATDLAQGNTFTTDRVQSYTDLANSPSVTGPVARAQNPPLSSDDLAGKITADAPADKVLINLHVTDTDAGTAARLANAVAVRFATVVEDTEKTDADGKSPVRLTITHPAMVPSSPIKPNKTLNIGLGVVLGLLVGLGIVVVRDRLDNTVKSIDDFEELSVPVLGLVPFDKRAGRTPIAFRADTHSARSEAYRLLRTNLQFVSVDATPRVIAVTSAVPGEGKTTTAINLAAALADAGHNVCLLELDLRRPTIAGALGLSPDVGFTTALIGRARVEDVMQSAGRNLTVLACGPIPPNPSELLITEQARALVRHIAGSFDFTIIDSAPLLPVADGSEVVALADATLLVHHAGRTTFDHAARSIDTVRKTGDRPVGVVLNMITRQRGAYDSTYGYYYLYRPGRTNHRMNDDDRDAAHSAVRAANVDDVFALVAPADARGAEPAFADLDDLSAEDFAADEPERVETSNGAAARRRERHRRMNH